VADLIIFLRGNLRMLSPDGAIITFFGPSSGSSIRGRQQGAVSALGIVTVIAYDANSRTASETRTDPVSGDQAALVYTFASTGPHTGRILGSRSDSPARERSFPFIGGTSPTTPEQTAREISTISKLLENPSGANSTMPGQT